MATFSIDDAYSKPKPAPAPTTFTVDDAYQKPLDGEVLPPQRPQSFADKASAAINNEMQHGVGGQLATGVAEGLAGLPGYPLDAIVGGGNFIRRQFDLPETKLEDTPLKDWGSQGWTDYAFPAHNLAPEPANDLQRVARKTGLFFGGAIPFGPAGMLPAATATAGSEVGRAADQVAPELTKGYGETVGAIAGGFAPETTRMLTRPGIPAPTNDQLRAHADAAYQAADNAGVILSPQSLQRLRGSVDTDLANFGYDPALQPGIAPVLDRIDQAGQQNATLKHVDLIRRVAQNAARDGSPSQRAAANQIIDHIDNFLENLQPNDVVTGNAPAAVDALSTARSLWSRLRKSEMIDQAFYKAENRAASTGTGGNEENAIRQNIRQILDNPKKARSFSKDERALMERVVRGGPVEYVARILGKFSPLSSTLPAAYTAMTGIGASLGTTNPVFAIPAGVGLVAKPIAEALARGNVEALSEAVRRGSVHAPRAPANIKRLLTNSAAPAAGTVQPRRRMLTAP